MRERGVMLRELKKRAKKTRLLRKGEHKRLRKIHKLELVKRSLLFRIAAAWIVTVPVAGLVAAGIFFMIRGVMLP